MIPVLSTNPSIIEPKPVADFDAQLLQDALDLFTGRQSGHMIKYMYDAPTHANDNRNGGFWFEQMCAQPDYYLRTAEAELIASCLPNILPYIATADDVAELGPGAAVAVAKKTSPVLAALKNFRLYTGYEINPAYAAAAFNYLQPTFPNQKITMMVTDFFSAQQRLMANANLVLCFGNFIGNFPASDVFPNPQIVGFLKRLRGMMTKNAVLLIGQDSCQDPALLEAAYNNTAAENWTKSLITRLGASASTNLDASNFAFTANWNPSLRVMEMGLRSLQEMNLVIGRNQLRVAANAHFCTWNSHKYTIQDFQNIAGMVGFMPVDVFTNSQKTMSLHVLRAV